LHPDDEGLQFAFEQADHFPEFVELVLSYERVTVGSFSILRI
jgi:hypothetical protein